MLTGIALYRGPGRDFPGATAFVFVVVALILLIFLRMYVFGGRSRRRTGHRFRETKRHPDHPPEQDGNHHHQQPPRRRPNRH